MNNNNIIDLYVNKDEDERIVMKKITSRTWGVSQSMRPTQPQANPGQSLTSYKKEIILDMHFKQRCADWCKNSNVTINK